MAKFQMGHVASSKGRPKTVRPAEEELARDPAFQKNLKERTIEAFDTTYARLLGIVNGTTTETVVLRGRNGEPDRTIEVPFSADVVVKAAKELRGWTYDKAIADKKDVGHEKEKGKGQSITEALNALKKFKDKERQEAISKGKNVVPIVKKVREG